MPTEIEYRWSSDFLMKGVFSQTWFSHGEHNEHALLTKEQTSNFIFLHRNDHMLINGNWYTCTCVTGNFLKWMRVIWAGQCSNQSCQLSCYSAENSQIRLVGQARSHETIRKQETPEGCSPQKGGDGLSGSWKNSEKGGTLGGEVERATIWGRPDVGDSFRSSWEADQLILMEQLMSNHEVPH